MTLSYPGGKIGRVLDSIVNFLGRISGIVVSLLVVRLVGVGQESTSILLAIAVFTWVSNSLQSVVELQTVAEFGRSTRRSPSGILVKIAHVGLYSALISSVAIVIFGVIAGSSQIVYLYLILALALPIGSRFAVYLALGVVEQNLSRAAYGSFIRLIVVVSFVLLSFERLGVYSIALALLLGEFVRYMVVSWWWKETSRRSARCDSSVSHDFNRQLLGQLPGSFLGGSNPTIDRFVVAILGLGSLAVLDLAEKYYGFGLLLFTQGVLPILYRQWAVENDPAIRWRLIVRSSFGWAIVGAVGSLVAYICIGYVGLIVFGGTDPQVVGRFGLVGTILFLALPAQLFAQILVRWLILTSRSWTLSWISVSQVAVNVSLDLLFGSMYGIPGIAVATVSTTWLGAIGAAVLCIRLRHLDANRVQK